MTDTIKAWLRAKGVTNWVDWDITDEKEGGELDEAAAWFAAQLDDYEEFVRKYREEARLEFTDNPFLLELAERDRIASMEQHGAFEVHEVRRLPPPDPNQRPIFHNPPKEFAS